MLVLQEFELANDIQSHDLLYGRAFQGTYVYAFNDYFLLTFDTEGDFWHQGIGFILRPDLRMRLEDDFDNEYRDEYDETMPEKELNIAVDNCIEDLIAEMKVLADDLFDELSEHYELSKRETAWTSCPYVKSQVRK